MMLSFTDDLSFARRRRSAVRLGLAGRPAPVFAGQWHTLAVQAVANVSAVKVLSLQWATVEKQTTGTSSLRPPVTKVIEGISKNRLAANKLESGEQLQHSSSCLAATPNLRTLYVLSSATLRT